MIRRRRPRGSDPSDDHAAERLRQFEQAREIPPDVPEPQDRPEPADPPTETPPEGGRR